MSVTQATDLLILRLQRREISSSRAAALETAQLLYRFVGSAKYTSIEGLLESIRTVGRRLVEANPKELAVGNIIRKILKLIREEYRVALASFLAQQPVSPLPPPISNSKPGSGSGSSGSAQKALSISGQKIARSGSGRAGVGLGVKIANESDESDETSSSSSTSSTDDEPDVQSPVRGDGRRSSHSTGTRTGGGSDSLPPTPGIHAPSGHFLSDDYLRKAGIPSGSGVGAGVGVRGAGIPGAGIGGQTAAQQVALQHALSTLSLVSSTSSLSSTTAEQLISEITSPLSSTSIPGNPPSSTLRTPSSSSSRPALHPHATLSNFVQMRHTRAQLERAGSTSSLLGMGLDGLLEGMGMLGGQGIGTVGTSVVEEEMVVVVSGQGQGQGQAGRVEKGQRPDQGQGHEQEQEQEQGERQTEGKSTQRDRRESHSRRTSFPGLLPIAGGAMSAISATGLSNPNSPTKRTHKPSDPTPSLNPSSTSTTTPTTAQSPLQRINTHQHASEQFAKKAIQLKPVLVDAIREVVDEIETTHESCAKGAREHIHSSEIILTIGASRTVEAFLKAAWKDRNFTVFITETAPSYQGHTMAKNLARHGIHTILVPDSSAYALMPRVTKVIFGAHSVLANGGVFAISGALLVALAAQAHATPVVIVSGQYKFAPAWNLNHDFAAVDFKEPEGVLNYADGDLLDHVEISNPFYDYIRPELINLFITNEGDHSPSYLYKIIKEAYDDEDLDL